MFDALYTSILYRNNKVKKYKEGFIYKLDKRIVLLDCNRKLIESSHNNDILEEGLELELDKNYVLVMEPEKLSRMSEGSDRALKDIVPVVPAKRRMGLQKSKSSNGLNLTIAPRLSTNSQESHLDSNDSQATQDLDFEVSQRKDRVTSKYIIQPIQPGSENQREFKQPRMKIRNECFSQEESTNSHVYSPQLDQENVHSSGSTEVGQPKQSLYPEQKKFKQPNIINQCRQSSQEETSPGLMEPLHVHGSNIHQMDALPTQRSKIDMIAMFSKSKQSLETPLIPIAKSRPKVASSSDTQADTQTNAQSKFSTHSIIAQPSTNMQSKFRPYTPPTLTNQLNPPHPKAPNPKVPHSNIPTQSLTDRFSKPKKSQLLHNSIIRRTDSATIVPSKPTNKYNLSFVPPLNSKQYRVLTIPSTFKDTPSYLNTLKNTLIEPLNLDLSQLFVNFLKASKTSEKSVRTSKIGYYENVMVGSFVGGEGMYGLEERGQNVVATVENKEHHSAYSKGILTTYVDDIWILSDTRNMTNPLFFKSFYYGPSGSSIELTPLAIDDKRWKDRKMYAIRAINAHNEIQMIDVIDNFLPRTPLLSHLMGSKKPARSLVNTDKLERFAEVVDLMISEHGLNADQGSVIRSFCDGLRGCGDPIVLVHGVYGAGKSFVIAILIMTLSKAFRLELFNVPIRVSFASMTNVAVDRILTTLIGLGFVDFVRVGSLRKIDKRVLPYTVQARSNDVKDLKEMLNGELDEDERRDVGIAIKLFQAQATVAMLNEAFLIGLTCLATSFEVISSTVCTIAILDEASQMTEPMSLLPLAKLESSYCLLVGDPKQLAPTLAHNLDPNLTDRAAFGLERTLFERLAVDRDPILLGVQYRCHPQISALSNNLFYGGKLADGVTATMRSALVADLPALVYCEVAGTECRSAGGSYRNEGEAKLILKTVETMISKGVEGTCIGVISLYKGQSEYLSGLFREKGITGVLAATVDSFQGSEKQVIIVSTVRNQRSVFLEEERRINVALTRAKCHLIICVSESLGVGLWGRVKELSGNITDSNGMIEILMR